ncbi:hypothetical protein EV426DRAFT_706934 [Tirmania nivea]|nr:hypothetical protein EV426DRAFT_706934 [Tirmania nivea]
MSSSDASPSSTTHPHNPPQPQSHREPTPDPPPHPGGGYGLGEEEPKPLTIRPIYGPSDLDPSGQHYLTILRLITDSIAQQSKVLSRHVVLHPPLLRPFSDNLNITLPIPPVIIIFLGVGIFMFLRLLDTAMKDGGGGISGSGYPEAIIRTLCYMGAAGFVYLSIVERVIGMYGGFLDRAAEVAKAGLPTALGISGPNDSSIKGWVVEWGTDIVGFLAYKKLPAGRSASSGKMEKERVEIKAFTVKIVYRGQGLGKGLIEKMLDEEMKFGEGGRKVEVGWAKDCVNGYGFVPRWLRGGLDRECRKVSERVEKMISEREWEWVEKDRGKKRE